MFFKVACVVAESASEDKASMMKVLKFFLEKFREVMDDKTSSHVEQAMAVRGYGCFASVREREREREREGERERGREREREVLSFFLSALQEVHEG